MCSKDTEISGYQSSLIEKLCVIIPTYNNAGTLEDVILRSHKYCNHIIVVNDGSTDATVEILDRIEIPITVVSYKDNRGKGHALIQGFKKALSLGWKYAITIDSDGQHYPEDIPLLIEAELQHPNAIIVGSRNLEGKELSKGSLFANKFSNFWFTLQTGKKLSDTQTGYRLYPLEKLNFFNLVTSRYESELELLVFSSWNDAELVEVPVNVYYPSREERVSHFRPCYDFARISLLNTLLCIGALLYGYPRKLLFFLRSIIYSVISLLFFLVAAFLISCFALVYLKFTKATDKKKENYHKLLFRIATFVAHHIPGTKFSISNSTQETFKKPAVIISNHQSHLDLMYGMMLTPKLIILTKKWVWNNPFYGIIVRLADFVPITEGYEKTIEYAEKLVAKGYSVLVYPEGTRSVDCSIQRFHRGAFYLAEQLHLDIVPMIEYGPGKVLPKTGWRLLPGRVHIEIKERITQGDVAFGNTFKGRAKKFERYYVMELARVSDKINFG